MQIDSETHDWKGLARTAAAAAQFDRSWVVAAYSLGLAYLNQDEESNAQREFTRAVRLSASGAENSLAKAEAF
ncbi:MAG: hypothetical protein R3C68_18060 [Myxococcota bacterium]